LHDLIFGQKFEVGRAQFPNVILQVCFRQWYGVTITTYSNILLENESRGT